VKSEKPNPESDGDQSSEEMWGSAVVSSICPLANLSGMAEPSSVKATQRAAGATVIV